jgi:type II secretory pathway pseudopilin PulG
VRRVSPGFALLELLVSIALLALCGIGMLSLLGRLSRLQEKSQERAHAHLLARAVLEEAVRKAGQTASFPQVCSINSAPTGDFSYRQDVQDLESGLKRVRVSVFRRDGSLLVQLGTLVNQP